MSGGYLFTRSADAAAHLCVDDYLFGRNEKMPAFPPFHVDNFKK